MPLMRQSHMSCGFLEIISASEKLLKTQNKKYCYVHADSTKMHTIMCTHWLQAFKVSLASPKLFLAASTFSCSTFYVNMCMCIYLCEHTNIITHIMHVCTYVYKCVNNKHFKLIFLQ